MNSKLPLSVCLISGAEAHRIGRALASVQNLAREVIVVLNEDVGDGTDKIAEQHGAQVIREPWKGYIRQKNSAAQKATQPWILGLDADEVVSEPLQAEIRRLIENTPPTGGPAAYDFPRCTYYCGRWIRHGDWYPDRGVRLWQKGRAKWVGVDPHDRLEIQGPVGHLRHELFHYSYDNIDHQLRKIAQYSTYFAQDRIAQGRSVSVWDLTIRPWWRFMRSYFIRLGFLDGWQGFYIAWQTAFFTLTRYVKVLEQKQVGAANHSPRKG
jgi:glycosyltransferase involved in cell wall biosynthesis